VGQDHAGKRGDRDRLTPSPAGVARKWARAIATATHVPMPAAQVCGLLENLAERLVVALSGPAVDTQAASEVGARLVDAGFTGAQSLPRTFEVLSIALPGAVGDAATDLSCGRMIELFGALASGYACALRSHVIDQQEEIKQALSSAWQEVQRDLRASEARFREVFDSSPVGIAISEAGGSIVQTNRSLEDILGYSTGELLGCDLSELFSPGNQPIVDEHCRGLVPGRDPRMQVRVALRRADGEQVWAYLDGSVLRDAEKEPRYIMTMLDDITDLQLLEQRLHHQTLHDPQTDLANRQHFLTHLEQVLAWLEPSAVITLLHLDLDGFSAINDSLGPRAGDQVLDVVARRLEWVVADQRAMVARLGADEYAILIEPGDWGLDIGALAEAINTELAEPFYIDNTGIALTATIGVVQRLVSECEPEELMRAASATLRRIHRQRKRQWILFDPDADAAYHERLQLAVAMPGALETGQLDVTYQPVVALADHRLMAIEALLSWQHPELGVLSNDQCVQAAERTGVVYEVGQWLLRTAAEQALAWRRRVGERVPPVVVNLMPSQAADPDLITKIKSVLAETGLPSSQLEIRTPVGALRTVAGELAGAAGTQAEDNVRVLAELGVRAGLYDFGGGMGGLRCVADLAICTVRIAKPISQQVADDPSRILSQAAQALVHIVRGAGVNVIAYPVDSAEQAACWPWIGANWAVGALFGPPGPPQNIDALLDAPHDTA
jgi:PAS domain S-box-containing protein/diguanylate cyclase (GGDEF)-like protein